MMGGDREKACSICIRSLHEEAFTCSIHSWDNGPEPEELREVMYAAGECRLRERMPLIGGVNCCALGKDCPHFIIEGLKG